MGGGCGSCVMSGGWWAVVGGCEQTEADGCCGRVVVRVTAGAGAGADAGSDGRCAVAVVSVIELRALLS